MIYVFLITSALLVYTFVGYPLLMGWLARRAPKVAAPIGTGRLSVTAVLVACNESAVIQKKLKNLLALNYPPENLKIIVVDDASNDGTGEAVLAVADSRVTLLRATTRSGKAAGLNMAMACVNSELALMVDARQEIELDALLHLAAWFEASTTVGAVSGELQLGKEGENDFARGMDGYWRYEKYIRKAESMYSSVPGVTGAIYLLRIKAFQPILPDTILDDVLIPMQCVAQRYTVGFDDRAVAWDTPSNDPVRERRRKTRTICGNYQLLFRFPSWLVPGGHPIWWQYVSHKVLRLIAPFLAMAGFAVCARLSLDGNSWATAYCVTFASIVALYPLSKVAPWVAKRHVLRILTAFVALNWFSLLGLKEYLTQLGQTKPSGWK